jgi:o-succinylbenzoate synthase
VSIAIRRVHVRRYHLPFRAPVETSAGRFAARVGWLVGVESADGRFGWGDAAPWPGFGSAGTVGPCDPAVALAAAEGVCDDADAYHVLVGDCVEAQSAFSQAVLSLAAEADGLPLRDLAAEAPGAERVPVHALVNSPEAARSAVSRGYSTLKVKVGATAVDADLLRLDAIRRAVGPDVALRLDANGAYSGGAALEAVRRFAEIGPAFIEQPSRDLATCARLRVETTVRIALDEALSSGRDVHAALLCEAMDVAVIKPAFFASWTEACAAALQCRRAGVEVVVTCALESAIGRWGALHLAAALGAGGAPVSAAGLSAPIEPHDDVAPFPEVDGGHLSPAWVPGLGVSPC